MGAHFVLGSNKLEVRVGLPVQGHINVARKDLPLRSVAKLDEVTLGMLAIRLRNELSPAGQILDDPSLLAVGRVAPPCLVTMLFART